MGLEVKGLSAETKKKLGSHLSAVGTSIENPIDLSMVAAISPELYGEVIKIIGEDDNIDMIMAIGVGGDLFYQGILEAVEQVDIPVAINVLMPLEMIVDGYRKINGSRTVLYPDPVRAARALSRLWEYSKYIQDASE